MVHDRSAVLGLCRAGVSPGKVVFRARCLGGNKKERGHKDRIAGNSVAEAVSEKMQ